MSRRVLMVAYFFPPLAGAGVQRTIKYVKYLPEHGWDPVVVTTASTSYPARDPSLESDVPAQTPVLRAREVRAWRALTWIGARLPVASLGQTLTWPDGTGAWLPGAVAAALRAVRRYRPSVLYSTSPTETAHLATLIVARLTGLPWVADFRDEWTTHPWRQGAGPWLHALSERAEQAVAVRADGIVFAAPHYRLANAAATARAITITNGVDPDDMAAVGDVLPVKDRFRIAFVGTLYGRLDIRPVTAAMARLVSSGRLDPACCEVRIVGNVWLDHRPDAGGVPVSEIGYVKHHRAVREMAEASVLLLYAPSSTRNIPGKVFEYLGTGRPVLCVTRRDNPAFALVDEYPAGTCVAPDDAAGIETALMELYESWRSGSLEGSPTGAAAALDRFSRKRLAGQLSRVLNDAVDHGASAGNGR
jgi:glycosyltransferase involved in cell wall biosynthesis